MPPSLLQVNQDSLAQPMRPVRRADGLEVWRKPLAGGKLAVVFFHRNSSSQPARSAAEAAAPLVNVGACGNGVPLDLPATGVGSIVLRHNRSLCLGEASTCPHPCASPASPAVGAVPCNAADSSQRWSAIAANGQINSADPKRPKHDLNSGPACCPGLLIYPVQGHANEKWSYDKSSGLVHLGQGGGGRCIMLGGGGGGSRPPPPPPAEGNRTISVTWQELGLAPTAKVSVRNLWAGKDLGSLTGSFSASVAFHDALIFVLAPVKTAVKADDDLASQIEELRRVRRATGAQEHPLAVVRLAAGSIHRLREPIVLEGSLGSNLVIEGGNAEAGQPLPRVSSGRKLTEWKKATVGGVEMWTTQTNASEPFSQLFAEGDGASAEIPRSRVPVSGYLQWDTPLVPCDPSCPEEDKMGFRYREGDVKAEHDWSEAVVQVFASWSAQWRTVAAVHRANRSLLFSEPMSYAVGSTVSNSGRRYALENIYPPPGEIKCVFA